MGGRGSSSGMSDKPYGTEYETLYQSGNIKFVRYKNGAATTPAETMTNGRVYVTVNARDKIKSITYYNKHNKQRKYDRQCRAGSDGEHIVNVSR